MTGLTDEQRVDIVKYRLENAFNTLSEVESHRKNGFYNTAVNRMYYACYYMVSALLLKNGQSSHTHGGTIGLFGLHFIKTGVVTSELGKFYSELFELRQTGDYDDWKVVTEAEIMPLVPTVEVFLDTLEGVIREDGYLD